MGLYKNYSIFKIIILLLLIDTRLAYTLTIKQKVVSVFPSNKQVFKNSVTGCLKSENKVSYVSKHKKNYFIHIDNQSYGPFYGVSQITPKFNQIDGSYAYIIFNKDKTKSQAVIKGKKTKWYDKIADIAPIPNNGFVLHVIDKNKSAITFNTKKPKLYFDYLVLKNNFKISKDNRNYIYSALNNNKWELIFNDKVILQTDKDKQILTPFMSLYGQDKGAVIKGDGFFQIWYNGSFTKKWDKIIAPSFMDKNRLIFIGVKNNKAAVVIDNKYRLYDNVTTPLVSSKKNHIVYSFKKNNKWQMIFNNIVSDKKFDLIGGYSLSADESKLYFTAKKNDKFGLYVFGDKNRAELFFSVNQPVFSKNKRMAYKAGTKTDEFIIENNKKSHIFKNISNPYFTEKGIRYCIVKNNLNKFSFMKENIKPKKFYDFIMGPYSKNGIIVFKAREKNRWFLIVNGKKADLKLKGFLKNTPVEITEKNEVKALGFNVDDQIVLVTISDIESSI